MNLTVIPTYSIRLNLIARVTRQPPEAMLIRIQKYVYSLKPQNQNSNFFLKRGINHTNLAAFASVVRNCGEDAPDVWIVVVQRLRGDVSSDGDYEVLGVHRRRCTSVVLGRSLPVRRSRRHLGLRRRRKNGGDFGALTLIRSFLFSVVLSEASRGRRRFERPVVR